MRQQNIILSYTIKTEKEMKIIKITCQKEPDIIEKISLNLMVLEKKENKQKTVTENVCFHQIKAGNCDNFRPALSNGSIWECLNVYKWRGKYPP